MMQRIAMLAISVTLALIVVAPVVFAQSSGTNQSTNIGDANTNHDQNITVMTRNLYGGADLGPVIRALSTVTPPNWDPVQTAVDNAWANVNKTKFEERAEALADEIKQSEPLLVGLQEAEELYTGPADHFTEHPTVATNLEFDYLGILQKKLKERGLNYTPVVKSQNFIVEAGGHDQDVRLSDHDAILVRTDVQWSSAQAGQYSAYLKPPQFPLTLNRGWGSVDVKVRGKTFRFITTHLEPASAMIQVAQANEILQGPANPAKPGNPKNVILAGDFNSPADGSGTPTYGNLTVGAGFTDAWSVTHPEKPGLTCCQAELLDNTTSALTQRIDLVLFRGSLSAFDAKVVGDELSDRTPSGLWPSDHAGVVATLRWQNDQGEDEDEQG